jgi:hypothetical protein
LRGSFYFDGNDTAGTISAASCWLGSSTLSRTKPTHGIAQQRTAQQRSLATHGNPQRRRAPLHSMAARCVTRHSATVRSAHFVAEPGHNTIGAGAQPVQLPWDWGCCAALHSLLEQPKLPDAVAWGMVGTPSAATARMRAASFHTVATPRRRLGAAPPVRSVIPRHHRCSARLYTVHH